MDWVCKGVINFIWSSSANVTRAVGVVVPSPSPSSPSVSASLSNPEETPSNVPLSFIPLTEPALAPDASVLSAMRARSYMSGMGVTCLIL